MNWEKYGIVMRGANKKKILLVLNKPKTPTQIARDTKLAVSTVSKNLVKLCELELVACLTPNLSMGKFFKVTKEGREITKQIK